MLVDGSVWAWGHNRYGRLGDGTSTDRLSPVRIEGYGADTAMRLPPGGMQANHMFVVAADGTAMGSGSNSDGGSEDNSPAGGGCARGCGSCGPHWRSCRRYAGSLAARRGWAW